MSRLKSQIWFCNDKIIIKSDACDRCNIFTKYEIIYLTVYSYNLHQLNFERIAAVRMFDDGTWTAGHKLHLAHKFSLFLRMSGCRQIFVLIHTYVGYFECVWALLCINLSYCIVTFSLVICSLYVLGLLVFTGYLYFVPDTCIRIFNFLKN